MKLVIIELIMQNVGNDDGIMAAVENAV